MENNKEKSNQPINEDRRKLLGLAGAAGAGVLFSPLLSKAAPSTIIEAGSNVDTASYIIFKDGDTIYAKNGTTGKIDFQGTDASVVINNALNSLTSGRTWKEKVVLKGNFSISATINVPSYTILELQGKLTLNNGVNNRVIRNSDVVGGNTQIEIYGGEIDGNGGNQTYASYQTIQLQKATDSIIHNIYLHDANWAHLDIRACSRILVSDIFINKLAPRAASESIVGIMILDSRNIKISGGSINVSDDAIAISNETNNPTLSDGINCSDINISNMLLSSSQANAIRINEAEGSISSGYTVVCRRVLINNITIANMGGPRVIQMFRPCHATSFLEDSSVNNVTIYNHQNGDAMTIQNLRRVNFSNVNMRNIKYSGIVADEVGPLSNVSFVNINMNDIAKNGGDGFRLGSGAIQHKNIKIKNCTIEKSAGSCTAVRINNVIRGTFTGITINADQGIIETSPSDYNIISENDVSDISVTSNRIKIIGPNSKVKSNIGYVMENKGAALLIADGGAIMHGLAKIPTSVRVTPSIAGEILSVTAISSTTFTIAIKKPDGSSGTPQTIYWEAEV